MSYTWLPQTLADIADLCGLEAALRLADERGGERVAIPNRARDHHWLVTLVGRPAADLICHRYGRTTIDVPRGPSSHSARLTRRVIEMIDAGATNNEIVRATGLVFRSVQRHRRRSRTTGGNNGQGSLF